MFWRTKMNKSILAEKIGNASRVTICSVELVDSMNKHRLQHGEPILTHADFMAKVPKVLGLETSEKFRSSYLAGNGEHRPCYRFPKREACLMAMSYSYELQAQIFDRMTELENAQNQALQPRRLSRMELIQIAYEAEQENQELQQQVAVLEPKAQALDAIADASNTYTIRECAKTIGIKEKHLVNLLLEKGWCYREPSGRLQPYSTKTEQNIFINRPSPIITNPNTGEEKVHLHMRVTAHGLTRITALVNQHRGG